MTKEVTTISKPPVEDYASHSLGGFEWLPDSSAFLFSTNLDREFGALTRYTIATAEMETAFKPDADIGQLEICGANSEVIAFTYNRDGFDTLDIRVLDYGIKLPVPELPEGRYSLDCETGDEPLLMVRVDGWQTPGEIWMINLDDGTADKVFSANLAGLDPERLVRPKVVRMPARDGVELQGLLYLPPGAETGENAPPVLFGVHGGPSGQSTARFDAISQYHVARGIAVFRPNVRGSTGLGRTYGMLDDREKRLDSVNDLVDMLAYLSGAGVG